MAVEVKQVTRRITVDQGRRDIRVTRSNRSIVVNHVGRRGPQGIQGIQGVQGETGPPGSDAEDKNYVTDFTNQSSVTVDHNLGKYPAVTVTDSTGDQVEGDIEHISINQLIATFSASFTGRIVCN